MLKLGLVTGSVTPERARGAAHERRLARAQLAAHEHHVAVAAGSAASSAPSDSVSAGSEVSTMRTATTRL